MNDLISRQAAIEAILHNQEVYSNNFGDDPIDKYTIAIIDIDAQTIALLPSAERHGKWVETDTYPKCSVCGLYGVSDMNYCPNCGAKMEDKNAD